MDQSGLEALRSFAFSRGRRKSIEFPYAGKASVSRPFCKRQTAQYGSAQCRGCIAFRATTLSPSPDSANRKSPPPDTRWHIVDWLYRKWPVQYSFEGRAGAFAGGPPSKSILNLYEDAEGNLWIGSQIGMERLSRSAMSLLPLPGSPDADFGSVFVDRDGSILACSTSLYRERDGVMRKEVCVGCKASRSETCCVLPMAPYGLAPKAGSFSV